LNKTKYEKIVTNYTKKTTDTNRDYPLLLMTEDSYLTKVSVVDTRIGEPVSEVTFVFNEGYFNIDSIKVIGIFANDKTLLSLLKKQYESVKTLNSSQLIAFTAFLRANMGAKIIVKDIDSNEVNDELTKLLNSSVKEMEKYLEDRGEL
jgi:hypothetical protein